MQCYYCTRSATTRCRLCDSWICQCHQTEDGNCRDRTNDIPLHTECVEPGLEYWLDNDRRLDDMAFEVNQFEVNQWLNDLLPRVVDNA